MMQHPSRFAIVVALVLSAAACAPSIESHGDLPLPERLAQIQPGRTKSDVLTLLGTPSTTFNLDTERWYYVSNQSEEYMYHEVREVQRLVIVIEFDKTGKVNSIKKLGLADGQDVAMVSRTTPTSGANLSLFGQLIGNVGRFDTGASGDNTR
jgi:outer membrane protein assembly factor BamE (lipoprotein component of BamABCDE complex)